MSEGKRSHNVAPPPECLDISHFSASDAMPTVRVGQDVLARDKRGTWYAAKVMAERGEGGEHELKVHFQGWKVRFDEWLRPCDVMKQSGASVEKQLAEANWSSTDGHDASTDTWGVDDIVGKRLLQGKTQYRVRSDRLGSSERHLGATGPSRRLPRRRVRGEAQQATAHRVNPRRGEGHDAVHLAVCSGGGGAAARRDVQRRCRGTQRGGHAAACEGRLDDSALQARPMPARALPQDPRAPARRR